ncbi:CMP-N-acetylneuraminate-poly-alpha-2,8-sialyltransferase-like [Amphiura filiformis]|uniref:CMP-N-acetylneuraminate-poly-alpha-2, 8-sialyltransferase-like n=1 Tax=Amphiura filiformis TaxID=82378 RepID=UPI003B228E06
MIAKRIFGLLSLVSMISLLWMASNNPLDKKANYGRLIVERSKTAVTMETENPFTTNFSKIPNSNRSLLMTTASISANTDVMNYKRAAVMMTYLHNITLKFPTRIDEFFSNVAGIFSNPWSHDVNNMELFRLFYKNETKKNFYDSVMLTQRNTVNTSYGGIELPKESLLPRPPYKSCSVVGSSGILLGSKCGRLIDEKDFVFRFNLASIAGFEEDVGRKTNMTTMNPSILTRFGMLASASNRTEFSRSKLADQEGLIWTPMTNRYINRTLDAIELRNDSHMTLVIGNMNHFNENAELWKKYGLIRTKRLRPTTGFYFVSCAVHLCSEVHLYGFWPFTTSLDGRDIPAHYYDDIIITKYHDASHEIKLLLNMHRLGLLKFHIENCETGNVTYVPGRPVRAVSAAATNGTKKVRKIIKKIIKKVYRKKIKVTQGKNDQEGPN